MGVTIAELKRAKSNFEWLCAALREYGHLGFTNDA